MNRHCLPPADWIAPLGVSLSLALSVAGCFRSAPDQTTPPTPSEPTLAEQADLVRQGRSDVIRLDRTLVRDDDLKLLEGLSDKLRRINFSNTEITDAGLARLCEMHNLEQLRLSSPRITDAGLAHIASLEHLRFLHLLDVPMTDAVLDRLHGLSNLESLYLDHTKVTDQGLGRLIKALPDVHLHIDDHHHPLDPHAKGHAH